MVISVQMNPSLHLTNKSTQSSEIVEKSPIVISSEFAISVMELLKQ